MSHEVETMAYAYDTANPDKAGFGGELTVPWHGLGEKVSELVTPDEMLKAAGLDWEVEQRPLMYADKDGNMVEAPRSALIRSTDDKLLTVTGKSWKPVQNSDMLNFFKRYVETGDATLETAGSLRGGKVVWALANLKTDFLVGGNDKVDGYVLMTSYHEVGNATTIIPTTVRVVCANTMAMATRGASTAYKQSHTSEFDFNAAHETLSVARENIVKAGINANALKQMRFSESDAVRFLSTFFQPQEDSEAIEELVNERDSWNTAFDQVMGSYYNAPGADQKTGWGVLNAVTHWADHRAGVNSESRLSNAWIGRNGKLKLDVEEALLKKAGKENALETV